MHHPAGLGACPRPLSADEVERDVKLTLPGGNPRPGSKPGAASSPDGGERGGLDARQVVIHHVDTVNVYTMAA